MGSQSSQSELSEGDTYFEQLELINDEGSRLNMKSISSES